MTTEFMAYELSQYDPARLGGAAEFDGTFNPQEVRMLDVQLSPEIATVWTLTYVPPLGVQPVQPAERGKLVPLAHDTVGRLLMGGGGVANVEVEFDWTAGGTILVPASNIQLNLQYDPFDPVAQRIAPAGQFRAWIVPGALPRTAPNYRTRKTRDPDNAGGSNVMAVPVGAKRYRVLPLNTSLAPVGLSVIVLDGGGTPLNIWGVEVQPLGTFPPGGAANETTWMTDHPLPLGASVVAVGQVGGNPGDLALVSVNFELAF